MHGIGHAHTHTNEYTYKDMVKFYDYSDFVHAYSIGHDHEAAHRTPMSQAYRVYSDLELS